MCSKKVGRLSGFGQCEVENERRLSKTGGG